jgi:hypothetical protein
VLTATKDQGAKLAILSTGAGRRGGERRALPRSIGLEELPLAFGDDIVLVAIPSVVERTCRN